MAVVIRPVFPGQAARRSPAIQATTVILLEFYHSGRGPRFPGNGLRLCYPHRCLRRRCELFFECASAVWIKQASQRHSPLRFTIAGCLSRQHCGRARESHGVLPAGDTAYLAYDKGPGGPVAVWNATTPNSFSLSAGHDAVTDPATSSDGVLFAMRAHDTTEIRGPDLTLFSRPAAAELETPNCLAVPGVTLRPSGALIYEPFRDATAPAAPPATGIHVGIDIRDTQLRLRVYLPEPFAMLNTDVDGLHGGFLAIDEDGRGLFVLTTSGLTIVPLAKVPLAIGTIAPASGPSAGGTSLTIRGQRLPDQRPSRDWRQACDGQFEGREHSGSYHACNGGWLAAAGTFESRWRIRISRRCPRRSIKRA